jgi:hypothetical protein
MSEQSKIPCPFIYANGKKCEGHVAKVEAFKADVSWNRREDGTWQFDWGPRSHYHLSCSLKGNHAGYDRPDDPRMKFYFEQLPDDLKTVIGAKLTAKETEQKPVPAEPAPKVYRRIPEPGEGLGPVIEVAHKALAEQNTKAAGMASAARKTRLDRELKEAAHESIEALNKRR